MNNKPKTRRSAAQKNRATTRKSTTSKPRSTTQRRTTATGTRRTAPRTRSATAAASKRQPSLWLRFWAVILALVIMAGAALSIMEWATPKDWKGRPSLWWKEEQTQPETPTNISGGTHVNVTEENGIGLKSAAIAEEDYAANGVSAQAESAYTLTAEVTPSAATYKELIWTTAWNASDGWAAGKEVSDYVTVTPSDDTLSATVACAAPFAVQIQITVTYKHNSNVNATCTVDYRQKYQNAFTGYIALDITSGKKANFSSGADTRISIDFPFAEQAHLSYLGTRNGEISITAQGNDVYTLPMECKLTEVKMNYSSMLSRSFCEYPANCDMSGYNESAPLKDVTYTGGKCTGLMQKFMGITDYSRGNVSSIKSKLGSYSDCYFEYAITFTVNGEEKRVTCRLSFNPSTLAVAVSDIDLSNGSIVF